MNTARGYVLLLPQNRITTFQECYQDGYRFSEPVPNFSHSRNLSLICFVVIEENITHITMGNRGRQNQAGWGLSRLRLDQTEPLETPIAISRILENIPKRNKSYLGKRVADGGLLTEKGFEAIVEAIRRISPHASPLLNRYGQERNKRIRGLSSGALQTLAYQKEAVATALSIAGIDRHPLQEWTLDDSQPLSFLDGLPSARLREDPMVMHDLIHLPGFEILKTYTYGAAVFKSRTAKLTVILANRQPLEEQTGTDLIYFNETYQSFVMVQYKAMGKENGGETGFRLSSDKNLPKEIDRMDALVEAVSAYPPNSIHSGFRFTENPFFIKLCPRIVFNPDDIGLTPGMYLPLDYWKLLATSQDIVGPRGGRMVTYENVGRYLDNTEFATVVSKAWVGTNPNQSVILKDAILHTLETGKTVAVAVKSGNTTGYSIN